MCQGIVPASHVKVLPPVLPPTGKVIDNPDSTVSHFQVDAG